MQTRSSRLPVPTRRSSVHNAMSTTSTRDFLRTVMPAMPRTSRPRRIPVTLETVSVPIASGATQRRDGLLHHSITVQRLFRSQACTRRWIVRHVIRVATTSLFSPNVTNAIKTTLRCQQTRTTLQATSIMIACRAITQQRGVRQHSRTQPPSSH